MKRLNDIKGFTVQVPQWDHTVESCLPGWFYRMVHRFTDDVETVAVLLMQQGHESANFETGLEIAAFTRDDTTKARDGHDPLDVKAAFTVAHLEWCIRDGLGTAVQKVQNSQYSTVDALREQVQQLRGQVLDLTRDRDEWKAEAARQEHLYNDEIDRANRAKQHHAQVVHVLQELLDRTARHKATHETKRILAALVEQSGEVAPSVPAACWVRVTSIPDACMAGGLNRKIQVIKKIREVASLLLQEAKRMVDAREWFLVPPDQQDAWFVWAHANQVSYECENEQR